jgi:hypothetical protein
MSIGIIKWNGKKSAKLVNWPSKKPLFQIDWPKAADSESVSGKTMAEHGEHFTLLRLNDFDTATFNTQLYRSTLLFQRL